MPSPGKAKIARPLNDVAREERIIQALHRHESLDHPLDTDAAATLSKPSPTYQNMGVQTHPPANGNVFKHIYGREPSQRDYVHSMGSAGIGRFAADPRLNRYDLIYGAAYPAPTTVKTETYEDSGFQTASHDTRRKALARAKVKASMTAVKYRDAAFQAGYIVCAESRDELTAHSEQFSKTVRLDHEGNLLEGTIETRGLPNILGVPVLHTDPAPKVARRAADPYEGRYPRHAQHEIQAVVLEQPPRLPPPQSFNPMAQAVTKKLRNSGASISARYPFLADSVVPGADPIFESKYSGSEAEMNGLSIYDPGAEHGRQAQSSDHAMLSLGIRNFKVGMPLATPSMGLKGVASALPRSSLDSIAGSMITLRDRITLPKTPSSYQKAIQEALPRPISRSGDIHQQRAFTAVQSGAQSNVGSDCITFRSTNASRLQKVKSERKAPKVGSVEEMHVAARTGEGDLSRARDNPYRRLLKSQKPSQTLQYAPNPPVAADLFEAGNVQIFPEPSSLRRKRTFDHTGIEPAECKPGTERLNRDLSSIHRDKDISQQKFNPGKTRDDSSTLSIATRGHSDKSGVIASNGADRSNSARVGKSPISHASRKPRQPTAPYVPPAMRPRDHKDYKVEKKR